MASMSLLSPSIRRPAALCFNEASTDSHPLPAFHPPCRSYSFHTLDHPKGEAEKQFVLDDPLETADNARAQGHGIHHTS